MAFDALTDTEGSGATVIVKLVETPVQPFTTGVTVIVAVIEDAPTFVAAKEILPEPLAAKPMLGVLLVQL